MTKFFSTKLLFLCIALWISKSLIIALITPVWQGEDEISHHAYADLLARTDKWGVYDQLYMSQELDQAWQLSQKISDNRQLIALTSSTDFKNLANTPSQHWISTAYQPPLYYWLLARVLQIPFIHALSVVDQLFILRLCSILISTLTIILAHACLQQLNTTRAQYLITMALITANPQFSFLNSMVNVDVLVIAIWSLLWFFMLKIIKNGWQTNTILGVSFALVLGLLTKQSTVFALPALAALLIHSLVKKQVTKKNFFVLIICMLLSANILISEYYTRTTHTQFLTDTSTISQSGLLTYILTQTPRISETTLSGFFQATHGQVNYQMSQGTLIMLKMMLVLALIGIIDTFARQEHKSTFLTKPRALQLTALLTLTWVVFLLAWDYQAWQRGQYWIKGRYLFPMMIPLMFAVTRGLQYIVPSRFHRHLTLAIPLLMMWAQLQTVLWFAITILYI